MRDAFIKVLEEEAVKNKDIYFLTGDLGYSVIENFQAKLPNQFLNMGVAEQNMAGVAAGLASTGKTVFIYSIGNFSTLRCLEQIRNDICYHNLNVKVVAVGGGLHYGALASTHHATEDLAIMRALPNMVVVAPGDRIEAELATRAIIKHKGPCYLRISSESEIHLKKPKFKIGRAITVKNGKDITIISAGNMLKTALRAATILEKDKIAARVISMHTLKPLDEAAVLKAGRETKGIVTIEEHTLLGGLGSAVAEVLAVKSKNRVKLATVGIPGTFSKKIGDRDFLRNHFGLTPENVAKAAKKLVNRK
jgi:transketolase